MFKTRSQNHRPGTISMILGLFATISLGAALLPVATIAQETKAQKVTAERVQTIFETLYANNCVSLFPGETPSKPEIFEFTFNYEDEDYPPRPYTLFQYLCFQGAYNQGFVYFGVDDYDEIARLQFAVPTFDVTNETDDYQSPVTDIAVTGFMATDSITNAYFDLETKTIISFSKWRGLGDAFSAGEWAFEGGNFVLKAYDVDADYDGQRQPTRIYGEGKSPEWE